MLLPEEIELPFRVEGSYVEFIFPRLENFSMLKLECK